MTAEQIEHAAMSCADMPVGASMPDMMLYHAMRGLYAEYRCGKLQRNDAKSMKNRLIALHSDQTQMLAVYEQHARIRKELSYLSVEITAGGCDYCKRVQKALCGIFERKCEDA